MFVSNGTSKLNLITLVFQDLTSAVVCSKNEGAATSARHPFNGLFSRTTWVSWHYKG